MRGISLRRGRESSLNTSVRNQGLRCPWFPRHLPFSVSAVFLRSQSATASRCWSACALSYRIVHYTQREVVAEFRTSCYLGWRSVCDFKIVLINEGALLWRLPEDEHAHVVCKNFDGLYFAGDSFGKHCSCGGTEGATQSAVYCVEAITGLSLRSKMLGDILA